MWKCSLVNESLHLVYLIGLTHSTPQEVLLEVLARSVPMVPGQQQDFREPLGNSQPSPLA